MRIIFALLLVVLCISGSAFAADGPDQARSVAEKALQTYKGMADWDKFNFKSGDELQNAALGESLPVFAFDVAKLSNGAPTLERAMNDANTLEFMVKANGRDVTRLTLRKSGDSYVRYRFGGSGPNLARGLASLPETARPDARLVVLGAAEFLYVNLPNQELLVAINAVAVGGIPNFKVHAGPQALDMLKQVAKGMLKDGGVPGGGLGYPGATPENRPETFPWVMPSLLGTILAGGGLYFYRTRTKTRVH